MLRRSCAKRFSSPACLLDTWSYGIPAEKGNLPVGTRFSLQDKIGDSIEFVGSYIIKAIANQILLLLYVLIES